MKYVTVIFASLLIIGCGERDRSSRSGNDQSVPTAAIQPDNTGINVRDRDNESAKTSGDQSENEADRKITQEIRQSVVADNSLSTNAKNIKIITADGAVTLRGPVRSEKEKSDIVAKAQQVAGVKRVDNQLEITN